jgi:hypothetical protein
MPRTAKVVMSIVAKEFEKVFAKFETSAIERFSRETIVPVSSVSNQRWGRASSLSK